MADCGRTVPSGSDDEMAAMTANYPESWDGFGRLHDIQFPYWHVCQAIAAFRDIAGMSRSDMEERGDVGEPATMVETMTRDGAGGWRSGNAETIGFDATWAGIRASMLGDGFSPSLIRTLEIMADYAPGTSPARRPTSSPPAECRSRSGVRHDEEQLK